MNNSLKKIGFLPNVEIKNNQFSNQLVFFQPGPLIYIHFIKA